MLSSLIRTEDSGPGSRWTRPTQSEAEQRHCHCSGFQALGAPAGVSAAFRLPPLLPPGGSAELKATLPEPALWLRPSEGQHARETWKLKEKSPSSLWWLWEAQSLWQAADLRFRLWPWGARLLQAAELWAGGSAQFHLGIHLVFGQVFGVCIVDYSSRPWTTNFTTQSWSVCHFFAPIKNTLHVPEPLWYILN